MTYIKHCYLHRSRLILPPITLTHVCVIGGVIKKIKNQKPDLNLAVLPLKVILSVTYQSASASLSLHDLTTDLEPVLRTNINICFLN